MVSTADSGWCVEPDRRISTLTETSRPILEEIRQWFASPLGQHVLKTESAMLDQLLPGFFGYELAQFSVQDEPLYTSSTIRNRISVKLESSIDAKDGGVVALPTQLPFANDSLDVVILHHLLDFAESPQEILRELARVTLPMGHLVFVGFNPHSIWGLWKSFAQFRDHAPWNGQFIRPGRLMDWLNLLNFKIDRAQYAIYRPPLARYPGKISDYSQGAGRNLNLPIGSVYVIVAQKHIGSIRPVKPIWAPRPAFGRLSAIQSVKHDGLASVEHLQQNHSKPRKDF